MNPESGETGNFLCCMSQTYATPSVGAHFALGDNEWVGMAKLPEYGPKYSCTLSMQTSARHLPSPTSLTSR